MYSSIYVEFIDTVSSSCVEYYSTYVYLGTGRRPAHVRSIASEGACMRSRVRITVPGRGNSLALAVPPAGTTNIFNSDSMRKMNHTG